LITRPNLTARRGFAIAFALLLPAPPGLAGQRLVERFASLEPLAAPTLAFGHPDDYRWEGVLVGSIAVGLLGAILGNGLCHFDRPDPPGGCVVPTFLGLLFGGATGAGVGGLLGGLIPKGEP
jgi:hypothetical protein